MISHLGNPALMKLRANALPLFVTILIFLLSFNISFKNLIGFSEEDLLNMNINSILPVEWDGLRQELLEEKGKGDASSQPFEMDIRNSRDELIPVEVHCYLNEDANKPLGYWCFMKDIRTRKKH